MAHLRGAPQGKVDCNGDRSMVCKGFSLDLSKLPEWPRKTAPAYPTPKLDRSKLTTTWDRVA
ncbi:hypothetical protein LA76x_2805 [Lysobacter antibioticus]|uniref:Uncharacterized protein n=1 Tax=Lysobacter antibioticus TaxID=84531 RepID=A0A0S2FBL0_LYSAN|nr:hypothetical protein LA76x_2805 [Lysobacter antibioticus]